MSNPFHHAFSSQDQGTYSSGHGRARRPSYTSSHPSSRATAFSNLLNPSLQYHGAGGAAGPASGPLRPQLSASRVPTPQQEAEPDLSIMAVDASPSHPWVPKSTPLPPSSRAFSSFLGADRLSDPRAPPYFMPSYLHGSVYADKLDAQHKTRLEVKESQSSGSHSSHAGTPSSNGTLGSMHNGRTGGFHRGAAHNIVERSPGRTAQPIVTPVGELPSKWNRLDKSPALEASQDGLDAKYVMTRSSVDRDHEAAAVRADNPVPPQCGIYYFEITILSKKREETTIGIGFSSKKASLNRLPGWEAESWGYHGDDGNTFFSQNVGRNYGPRFTTDDIIGCGVNFHAGTIFFTKNGVNLGDAFRDVKANGLLEMYPIVGLKKNGEHIKANFGQTPFFYDIDGMYLNYKQGLWDEINSTPADELVPGLDETEVIQKLVLKYLQHDGYVETARAFAQETHREKMNLCLNSITKIEGPSIKDDEDATNRQAIRRAVLEGDIDKALDLTNEHYPNVLKDNQEVYFRLRCRKFIEMARKSAEVSMRGEGSSKRPTLDQRMELDEEAIDDDDQDTVDTVSTGKMEMSIDGDALVQEMLAYGQELQEEFASDTSKEVRTALEEAFALMAYSNPLKVKEMACLMDQKGRVTVAEELNSAILISLGRSRRSPLEEIWAQTDVFLEMLSEGEEGAFVSLKDLINQVPSK